MPTQSHEEVLRQRSLVVDAAASGVQTTARALSVICCHTADCKLESPSFSGSPSIALVEAAQQLSELADKDVRFASFLRHGAKNQTGFTPIDLTGAKGGIAIEKNLHEVCPNVLAARASNRSE